MVIGGLCRYGADMHDIDPVCDTDSDDLPGDLYVMDLICLNLLWMLGRVGEG